jgi:hypothetical protein
MDNPSLPCHASRTACQKFDWRQNQKNQQWSVIEGVYLCACDLRGACACVRSVNRRLTMAEPVETSMTLGGNTCDVCVCAGKRRRIEQSSLHSASEAPRHLLRQPPQKTQPKTPNTTHNNRKPPPGPLLGHLSLRPAHPSTAAIVARMRLLVQGQRRRQCRRVRRRVASEVTRRRSSARRGTSERRGRCSTWYRRLVVGRRRRRRRHCRMACLQLRA